MKRNSVLALALSLALLAAGCSAQGSPLKLQDADLPPVEPAISQQADQAFAQLAVELLKGAREGGEDALVSPLSVLMALAMTANGADGETLAAFEQVLGGGVDLDTLNANCASLIQDYAALGGSTQANLANSLWLDEGRKADPDFLQRCADTYGAGLFSVDLDTQKAVNQINSWVSEQTREKIQSIIEEPPSGDAALILVNAVYLKNAWQQEFDAQNTHPGVFYPEQGGEITVEFLSNGVRSEQYLSTGRETGVILPYDDGRLAFLAVMPTSGNLSEYLAGWDGGTVAGLLDGAEETRLSLQMPKFEAEWGGELSELLAQMGLESAFQPDRADFSRMSESEEDFYLSSVLHKTRLEVHEKGTEAAAVTAVMVECTSAAPVMEYESLRLERPFVYAIVDLQRQLPLFLGTYSGV